MARPRLVTLTPDELERWLVAEAAKRPPLPPPRAREQEVPAAPESGVSRRIDVAAFELPPEGRYACKGCGAALVRPGECAACARRRSIDRAAASLLAAREAVPPEHRWVDGGDDRLLATACAMHNPRAVAERAARDLTGPLLAILIVAPGGQSRPGKSTLAAAIYYRALALARGVVYDELAGEPPVLSFARRARWATALDVVHRANPRTGEPAAEHVAPSLLVVDDLGQEHVPGFVGGDRTGVVRALLLKRWELARPSVLTTWLTRSQLAASYGGAVEGRLFADKRARVIEVNGA